MAVCVPGADMVEFDEVVEGARSLPGLFADQTEELVSEALKRYFATSRGHFFLIGGPEEDLFPVVKSTYAPPEGGRLLLDGVKGMTIHSPAFQPYLRSLSHLPGALLVGPGGSVLEYNVRLGEDPVDFLLPTHPGHSTRHHYLARKASEEPGVYFSMVATNSRGVVYRDGEAERVAFR